MTVRKLLRALVAVSALSMSAVSSGQSLVVYEGTAEVRSVYNPTGEFPFAAEARDEFRFRATIDSSAQPSSKPELQDSLGGLYYEGAILDLAVWINGEPLPIPPTVWDPAEFNNIVHVRNNASNAGQPMDLVMLIWDQIGDDGQKYQFIFNLEDSVDAVMLSSTAIPTTLEYSEATGWGLGFNVYPDPHGGFNGLDMFPTGFVIQAQPSISSMLQELLTNSTGVGPGKSLANKVRLAQAYYAVPDIPATCAVLESFLHEVRAQSGKKKLSTAEAQALSGDAAVIMRTIRCE